MKYKYNIIDPSVVKEELKQYLLNKKQEYLEILYDSTIDGADVDESNRKLQELYAEVGNYLKNHYTLEEIVNLYMYVHNQEEKHKKRPHQALIIDDKPVDIDKNSFVDSVEEYRNYHSQKWILKQAQGKEFVTYVNSKLYTPITDKEEEVEEIYGNER